MNKHAHPQPSDDASGLDYESDGYGWAMAQARYLRERKVDALDWANLADEIEAMGRSEWRGVESALRVLLLHLLKWDHQPSFRSRSWYYTIREQHRQYQRRLAENPGLKPYLGEIRAEAYRQARVEAVAQTGLSLDLLPVDPPGWNVIENPPVSEDDIPVR